MLCGLLKSRAVLCAVATFVLAMPSAALWASDNASPNSPQDVITYHGDNNRSGWFSSESLLTVANVSSGRFGLLHIISLDGRVDAEPLFVSGQTIQGQGVHDVVYVATEANSVYAIDAISGAILWHVNYGIPVTDQFKNYDDNVFPVIGILGTPVIDRTLGNLYFVSDTLGSPNDIFTLHAVSLSTGHDAVRPAVIQYSTMLSDGTQWMFNPHYHLQRAGLLEANGSIYVTFGSNGDIVPTQSRGTILRYDAATLTPLTGDITDKLHESSQPFYLSSIWQSGYGIAADANGSIFFSTGNSNPSYPSYDASFNRPDSMVRLSADLMTLVDSFTTYNYFSLDQVDADVGSGGMLLLPDQAGPIPHLAIAGGKDGRAFLINRDHMGGYTDGGPDNVVQTINMGGCWCGPSYFVGSDGATHILTGGGNGVTSWKLQTSPSVQLIEESTTGTGPVQGLPDNGGTIPVVSSNGATTGTGIVWFVQRPSQSSDMNPGTPVTLHAYNAANLQQSLFSALGGTWTHAVNSNANLVPTVAKGHVYVTSNMQLRIFGLLANPPAGASAGPASLMTSQPETVSCPAGPAAGSKMPAHELYGTVCQSGGHQIKLALRSGAAVSIDVSQAFDQHRQVLLTPGRPLHVSVSMDKAGVLHAYRIAPAHTISPETPADK